MKVRAVRTLATWLCFASCALMGVATKPGLVVCIGLDGHLDLSSLAEGCGDCVPELFGFSGEAGFSSLALTPASCCPCLDLPLPPGQQATPRLFSKSPDSRLKAGIPSMHVPRFASFAVVSALPTSLPGDVIDSPLSLRRGVLLRT